MTFIIITFLAIYGVCELINKATQDEPKPYR